MTDAKTFSELVILLGGLAGILGIFTAILFWAVKNQVSSLKQDHKTNSTSLQNHLDKKLEDMNWRIDDHEKRLSNSDLAQLKLRNELLEDMRTRYVRHDDIVHIKESIVRQEKVQNDIFQRMDKIIFKPGGIQ